MAERKNDRMQMSDARPKDGRLDRDSTTHGLTANRLFSSFILILHVSTSDCFAFSFSFFFSLFLFSHTHATEFFVVGIYYFLYYTQWYGYVSFYSFSVFITSDRYLYQCQKEKEEDNNISFIQV